MSIEYLNGIEFINDIVVYRGKDPNGLINIDHENATITFRMQQGKVSDYGRNGCRVIDIVRTCLLLIDQKDRKSKNDYKEAISKLHEVEKIIGG